MKHLCMFLAYWNTLISHYLWFLELELYGAEPSQPPFKFWCQTKFLWKPIVMTFDSLSSSNKISRLKCEFQLYWDILWLNTAQLFHWSDETWLTDFIFCLSLVRNDYPHINFDLIWAMWYFMLLSPWTTLSCSIELNSVHILNDQPNF